MNHPSAMLVADARLARVNAAKAAYVPTLQSGLNRNSQLQPPTSLFAGAEGLETGVWSANASVVQLMPWGGGNYLAGVDTSRTTTNSLISSFNPSVNARLQFAFSQPLLRDFHIDATRAQIDIETRNRTIAETRTQEEVVGTLAEPPQQMQRSVHAEAHVEVDRGVGQRMVDRLGQPWLSQRVVGPWISTHWRPSTPRRGRA